MKDLVAGIVVVAVVAWMWGLAGPHVQAVATDDGSRAVVAAVDCVVNTLSTPDELQRLGEDPAAARSTVERWLYAFWDGAASIMKESFSK